MPELPEVEHAAGTLRAWLVGVPITRAVADDCRVFRAPAARWHFVRSLRGRTLLRVDRRGKYLLLSFDGDVGVLSHLGMTGRWERALGAAGSEAKSSDASLGHSRAHLQLADGSTVHYCDPRMFGRLAVVPAAELASLPELLALGPDPLRDGVDAGVLHAALQATRRPVKVALMDGAVVAGLGNIHASEALFRARILPMRPSSSLSRREVGVLARAIADSIGFAVAEIARTTPPDQAMRYLSDDRDDNPFLVYGRAGTPCSRCGTLVETQDLGGRSSAYCPGCQK